MESNKDALTGLPDRTALDQTLKTLVERDESFGLVLLDIDHFLAINEAFGHASGDGVLRTLANLLAEYGSEQAHRISGDEFALVLRGVSLEQAFLRMETLRGSVQAAVEQFGLPDARTVTITAGVAQYPRDAKDVRGMWQAAAAALSSAKEGGRNQVGLPPNEEMVMKTCYYAASSVRKLKALADRLKRKESHLLREALDDLLRTYDLPRGA